jgi:hypothetical protein
MCISIWICLMFWISVVHILFLQIVCADAENWVEKALYAQHRISEPFRLLCNFFNQKIHPCNQHCTKIKNINYTKFIVFWNVISHDMFYILLLFYWICRTLNKNTIQYTHRTIWQVGTSILKENGSRWDLCWYGIYAL